MARTRAEILKELKAVERDFGSIFVELSNAVQERRTINPQTFGEDCLRLIQRHFELTLELSTTT